MLLLWDQRQFEELLVIDTRGRVIASTHEGQLVGMRQRLLLPVPLGGAAPEGF